MNITYRYNPEDYKEILGMHDDMTTFYKLLEEYEKDKTMHNRFSLEKHSRDFFFTLKHRELEGSLTHTTAAEIREYIGELLSD